MEESDKRTLWYRLGFLNDTPKIIYCIVAGDEKKGRIVGYVGNVEGKIVEYNTGRVRSPEVGESADQGEDPFDTFFRKSFGKRPARIPFLQSVKPLTIDRVVIRNSQELEAIQAERRARGVSDKLTLDDYIKSETATRYGLYEEILRPTKHRDFDTVDGVRFSVNSLTTLHVEDASPAHTVYQDNLLQTASALISSYISSTILSQGYEAYKKRSNELTPAELEELNKFLDQLGLKATKCVMTDPELNANIQASMEAEVKARNDARAKIATAEGIGSSERIIAEGKAAGIIAIANAESRRIGAVVDAFENKGKGLSGGQAVTAASRHLVGLATADGISKTRGTIAVGANHSILSINNPEKLFEEEESDDEVSGDANATPAGAETGGNTPATPAGGNTGVARAPKSRKGRKGRGNNR